MGSGGGEGERESSCMHENISRSIDTGRERGARVCINIEAEVLVLKGAKLSMSTKVLLHVLSVSICTVSLIGMTTSTINLFGVRRWFIYEYVPSPSPNLFQLV